MKKRQVVFYIVLMLSLLCTSVYATISGDISLTSSKTETLTSGEEFQITLSLKDIEATSGIDAINGYININEDVLEVLTVNSIVTNSDGKVKINDDNILDVYTEVSENTPYAGIVFNDNPISGRGDYRIVINLNKAIKTNTDLITITFKVKSDVSDGTYKNAIDYSLFAIYQGTTDSHEIASKYLDVVVSNKQEDNNNNENEEKKDNNPVGNENEPGNNDNNPGNNDNSNSDKNNNNNNNGNSGNTGNAGNSNPSNSNGNNNNKNNNNGVAASSQNGKDDTTAKGSLPNTGYKLLLLPIAIVAVLGIVFYKKYKKYNV